MIGHMKKLLAITLFDTSFKVPYLKKYPSIILSIKSTKKFRTFPINHHYQAFVSSLLSQSLSDYVSSEKLLRIIEKTNSYRLDYLIYLTFDDQFHDKISLSFLIGFLLLSYYVDDKNEQSDPRERTQEVMAQLRSKTKCHSVKKSALLAAHVKPYIDTLFSSSLISETDSEKLSTHWLNAFETQMHATLNESTHTHIYEKSLDAYLRSQEDIVGAKPFFESCYLLLALKKKGVMMQHTYVHRICERLIQLSCHAIRIINDCVSFWREISPFLLNQDFKESLNPSDLYAERIHALSLDESPIPDNAVLVVSKEKSLSIFASFAYLESVYNKLLNDIVIESEHCLKILSSNPFYSDISVYIDHIKHWPSASARWSLITERYTQAESL